MSVSVLQFAMQLELSWLKKGVSEEELHFWQEEGPPSHTKQLRIVAVMQCQFVGELVLSEHEPIFYKIFIFFIINLNY